jgi:hypothetical protein
MSGDQAVVLGVSTDPKPDNFLATRHSAEGAIVETYSNRENIFVRRQRFELKTGVSRILEKPFVGLSRMLFYMTR